MSTPGEYDPSLSYATTDLSDAYPQVQVAEPLFSDFGGKSAFYGPIETVKVFEDNVLVRWFRIQ